MVHVDPATLRRHPILGVLLGGACAVLMTWLLVIGTPEARTLMRQSAPDSLTLHDAVRSSGIRWITLTDGRWQCASAVTIERGHGFERWLLGPVESTEVPITTAAYGEVVVACFDGSVACAERAGSRLTGVVGSTEVFGGDATLRRWSRSGHRVAILNVGASPRYAMVLVVGLVVIAIGGYGFAGYYLRILWARRRQSELLPSTEPIQPR